MVLILDSVNTKLKVENQKKLDIINSSWYQSWNISISLIECTNVSILEATITAQDDNRYYDWKKFSHSVYERL